MTATPGRRENDDAPTVLYPQSRGPDGLQRFIRAWAMPGPVGRVHRAEQQLDRTLVHRTAFAFLLERACAP